MPPFDVDMFLNDQDDQEPSGGLPDADLEVTPSEISRRREVFGLVMNALAAGLFGAAGRPEQSVAVLEAVANRRERAKVRGEEQAERKRREKIEAGLRERELELRGREVDIQEEQGAERIAQGARALDQDQEQFESRMKQERGLAVLNLTVQARESSRQFQRQLQLEGVRSANERQNIIYNRYAQVAPQHAALFTEWAINPGSMSAGDAPTIAAFNAVNQVMSMQPQLDQQAQRLQMTAVGIRAISDVMSVALQANDPLNPNADPRALVSQTMGLLEGLGIQTEELLNFSQAFGGIASAAAEGQPAKSEALLGVLRRFDWQKQDPADGDPARFQQFVGHLTNLGALMAQEGKDPTEVARAIGDIPRQYRPLILNAYGQAKEFRSAEPGRLREQNMRLLEEIELRQGLGGVDDRERDVVGRPLASHGGAL